MVDESTTRDDAPEADGQDGAHAESSNEHAAVSEEPTGDLGSGAAEPDAAVENEGGGADEQGASVVASEGAESSGSGGGDPVDAGSDDASSDDELEDAELEDAEEPEPAPRGPIEEDVESDSSDDDQPAMDWYILKVQSNRENSICDALKRRVAVEGLDEYFGEILVPTEDVAEFKNGKRRVVKRKLYPGYIVAHMVINDDTWFAVRETPGIGDFTGAAGKPSPMLPHEVERIVKSADPEDEEETIKTAIPFRVGDRVRIKEGTFENFEGDVEGIDEANGRITVMINIFGRSTPVELEHWQVEAV